MSHTRENANVSCKFTRSAHLARLSRIGDGAVTDKLDVGRLLHRRTTIAVLTVGQV